MACLDKKVRQGTWLLEHLSDKMIPAVVAQALIREETERIPVRLLNTGTEPVVVYAGTVIATVEDAAEIQGSVTAVMEDDPTGVTEKSRVLWELAKAKSELSQEQQDSFFHVLAEYAYIFVVSGAELGHANKI